VGHRLLFTTRTQISGCLVPLLPTRTTVTLCSLEMVKQGPLLSWKIETWFPNCGVIQQGKVDRPSQLPVFFPLASDVHKYQILPQRLPRWKTCMRRVGDIRMNWPIVTSYNLFHVLICGSLSTGAGGSMLVRTSNHGRVVERRVPEMRCN